MLFIQLLNLFNLVHPYSTKLKHQIQHHETKVICFISPMHCSICLRVCLASLWLLLIVITHDLAAETECNVMLKIYREDYKFLNGTSACQWYINENDIPAMRTFQRGIISILNINTNTYILSLYSCFVNYYNFPTDCHLRWHQFKNWNSKAKTTWSKVLKKKLCLTSNR